MADDQQDLLRILEAHGQQFLESFPSPALNGKRKTEEEEGKKEGKRKRQKTELDQNKSDESEAEWTGFDSILSDDEVGEEEEDDPGDEDDQFVYETHLHQPDVVVFSDVQVGSSSKSVKAQMKAFMSSKVTKLTQDVRVNPSNGGVSEEDDDELTNAQNDALLHRLVHTQILSGSLKPDLDLKPAQRRKALAGRVLEASGKAKLGKGENAVRSAERNRAAQHVREGILEKQKERNRKELEEAKHMGNYHPTLKGLFDASASKTRNKKREKGLKLGVGSFKGGILRLGRNEIEAAERGSFGGRSRGSHRRGGKR
ncbi:hypothetical protein A0H81_08291 [Grifola frondosa]|uniref:Protein FAF1 n=1 Tax=Grifola frondosa TaxID=5627 RepID=A0A1C7M4X0_GRIFR|nr:hypothetical protein A0H81_08291 [Grifola frondosa]